MTTTETSDAVQQTDWYGPDVATFGDRLVAARDAAGMTQSQFSRRLGVKKSTVVAWEEDLSEPRANKLQMMAGLLSVSIGWLLTGQGEGVEALDEGGDPDLQAVLNEVRDIKAKLKQSEDQMARLEKRLRKMLLAQQLPAA
ncbi:Transcriptional regulator, contains XRE-family HTH domain [Salinihabitans flavidus]|uniref:Transcriptional regulator, contains XRE-family HTH domain n=1 Tax=Salinihabitans flavidus TaxID=569882 RepID=A0A1H8V418_9RHOB|nr:helix-turn-helix transcriptional regulator [Salinihabitans flavidus]SEP10242.1 Transcriptional regulator, contains XRE-family HTH domain [Salinihabitans flavidus]